MTIHDRPERHKQADPKEVRKAVRGAAIGNTVEWFDFAIYGFLAVYIAEKFFPSGDDTAALTTRSRSSPLPFSCGRSADSSSDHSQIASGASEFWPW